MGDRPTVCPACGALSVQANESTIHFKCGCNLNLVDGEWQPDRKWMCGRAYAAAVGLRQEVAFLRTKLDGYQLLQDHHSEHHQSNLEIHTVALEKKLEQAQQEFYGDANYGTFIADPHTKEYLAHRFWERASVDEDWRGSTPYTGFMY